jgi:hypothetical protein
MYIYLDESGDLGWKFNKPYMNGGSSRYLSIAYLLAPSNLRHLTKRIILKTYKKFKLNPQVEKKGNSLDSDQIKFFLEKTLTLLDDNESIKVGCITVKKENVFSHIRSDANKLYNYMISLALLDEIKSFPVIYFCPDPRTIKVQSGNSLVDYLQTKLWFELNSTTTICNLPQESHLNKNIQFIDWIAHLLWSRFEFQKRKDSQVLLRKIKMKHLYF